MTMTSGTTGCCSGDIAGMAGGSPVLANDKLGPETPVGVESLGAIAGTDSSFAAGAVGNTLGAGSVLVPVGAGSVVVAVGAVSVLAPVGADNGVDSFGAGPADVDPLAAAVVEPSPVEGHGGGVRSVLSCSGPRQSGVARSNWRSLTSRSDPRILVTLQMSCPSYSITPCCPSQGIPWNSSRPARRLSIITFQSSSPEIYFSTSLSLSSIQPNEESTIPNFFSNFPNHISNSSILRLSLSNRSSTTTNIR